MAQFVVGGETYAVKAMTVYEREEAVMLYGALMRGLGHDLEAIESVNPLAWSRVVTYVDCLMTVSCEPRRAWMVAVDAPLAVLIEGYRQFQAFVVSLDEFLPAWRAAREAVEGGGGPKAAPSEKG